MPPLLAALRPSHWIKNAWLAAPLLFAGRVAHPASLLATGTLLTAFCALSSAVYLINDVADRSLDQQHPDKRSRPVASGSLSSAAALLTALLLSAAGWLLAGVATAPTGLHPEPFPLDLGAQQWALAYLLNGALYSLAFKRLPVLDVLSIALGFVIRLCAGSAVLLLMPSRWLLVCGFCLALLLALGKRRLELGLVDGVAARPALAHYRLPALDRLLLLAAASCLLTYLLYAISPLTQHKLGSTALLFSLPPVALALARFVALLRAPPRRDLVALLAGDPWMLTCLLSWLAVCLAVVGVKSPV